MYQIDPFKKWSIPFVYFKFWSSIKVNLYMETNGSTVPSCRWRGKWVDLYSSASSIETQISLQILACLLSYHGETQNPHGSYGPISTHSYLLLLLLLFKKGRYVCVCVVHGEGWLIKRDRKPVIIRSGVVLFFRLWDWVDQIPFSSSLSYYLCPSFWFLTVQTDSPF